jgi:hypothetical protein
VLHDEVLISELGAVDGLATSSLGTRGHDVSCVIGVTR